LIYCRSAQGSPSIKAKCVAMVVETGPDEEWSVASGCRFRGGEVLPLGSLEHSDWAYIIGVKSRRFFRK